MQFTPRVGSAATVSIQQKNYPGNCASINPSGSAIFTRLPSISISRR